MQYTSDAGLSPAVSAVALVQAQLSSLNTIAATIATLTAGGKVGLKDRTDKPDPHHGLRDNPPKVNHLKRLKGPR